MPRYIDADALIDFLDVGHLRHPSELCFSEVDVANLLLHAPTISFDEARGVGEWEDAKQHGLCRCSPVLREYGGVYALREKRAAFRRGTQEALPV